MRLRVAAIATSIAALLIGLAPAASASPPASTAPAASAPSSAAVPMLEGGRAVYAPGGVRCALGFNVRKADAYYFLTGGRCAKTGLTIYADSALTVPLGTVVAVAKISTALVRYFDPGIERPGSVYLYPGSQDIVHAGYPSVGQRICRSGPLTGVRCGTVTATNLTINFPEGTINGVARTNICIDPPELPGAPYFAGTMAVGLELGSGGSCSTGGGASYFQPVPEILNTFGLTVY
ncbi:MULTISPECIES: S1 family peptidase [Actinomadura]|uniref:S1 family peptidase n=1 Tax=Actinomadura yumaensis TaxID=111807 RepID=A0ABW2CRM0_9ACTN|nr:S1 family peptidase [Actinomadura sp. J1-007]MWK35174.1 streptogrisin B precursor [Actinomadura sp. J1-007]